MARSNQLLIAFIANILFGNYRLPIKIYYICSCIVDKKARKEALCGGHSVFALVLVALTRMRADIYLLR